MENYKLFLLQRADINRGKASGTDGVGIVTTTGTSTIVGTATTFNFYENSNYIQVPESVIGIEKIFKFDTSSISGGMFSIKYQLFLNDLYYPLYFLDFETFTQAVPEWDRLRPYQNIPFQYSIHLIEREGEDPSHLEYLADESSDPRRGLVDRLIRDIPEGACVLAYNKSFEKRVVRDLAQQFPGYSDHLMDIHNNMLDLMIPFQKKHYYKKEMKGSYSIKNVLPALTLGSPYSKMNISDGMKASISYKSLPSLKNLTKKEKIKRDLKTYCRQDTQAMVDVLECLRNRVY